MPLMEHAVVSIMCWGRRADGAHVPGDRVTCRLAQLLPPENLESNTWDKSVTMAYLLNVLQIHPCKFPVYLHPNHTPNT